MIDFMFLHLPGYTEWILAPVFTVLWTLSVVSFLVIGTQPGSLEAGLSQFRVAPVEPEHIIAMHIES